MSTPVAFEVDGADGIRLVGADVVLEVSDEDEYEELWQGNYVTSEMKSSKNVREKIDFGDSCW